MEESNKQAFREAITAHAKSLGFDAVGFTGVTEVGREHYAAFVEWIKNNYEGEMAYMSEKERARKRRDLKNLMPGARTAIVFAVNYYRAQKALENGNGRVARYAFGRDYHKVIGKKLKQMEVFIKSEGRKYINAVKPNSECNEREGKAPNPALPVWRGRREPLSIETRSYADTGPILERALAERAGLGVIGKNACLITPSFGSWILISEILTNLELAEEKAARQAELGAPQEHEQTQPPKKSFSACGSCTRCIQACPTGAILAPGVIDARRCLSYLTIEYKGKIPADLAAKIGETKRIFGCDICQEVCPHNSRQKPAQMRELGEPKIAGDQLSLREISTMKNDKQFLQKFAGSAVMRAKLKGLKRNCKIASRTI